MAQLIICSTVISILSLISPTITQNPPTSTNKLDFGTLSDDGYLVYASNNSKHINIKTMDGLELDVTVKKNKFLMSAQDVNGNPLRVKCKANELGQMQFFRRPTVAKKICESRKFPNDYHSTVGIGAHKYHKAKKSWNDARKTCIEEGGHLVVINSDDEERVLRKHMDKAKWSDTWVGIHDLYSSGEWVTVQDVPLNETGWATWSPLIVPNPDNHGGNQHCVRLLTSGGMDDLQCDMLRHFICEIPCDYCLSFVDPHDLVSVV